MSESSDKTKPSVTGQLTEKPSASAAAKDNTVSSILPHPVEALNDLIEQTSRGAIEIADNEVPRVEPVSKSRGKIIKANSNIAGKCAKRWDFIFSAGTVIGHLNNGEYEEAQVAATRYVTGLVTAGVANQMATALVAGILIIIGAKTAPVWATALAIGVAGLAIVSVAKYLSSLISEAIYEKELAAKESKGRPFGSSLRFEAAKKDQKRQPLGKLLKQNLFNAETKRKRNAATRQAFVREHSPKDTLASHHERNTLAHSVIQLEKERAAIPAPLQEKISASRKSLPLAPKYAKPQKPHRNIQKLSEPYYRSLPPEKKAQFLANTMTNEELQIEADRLIIELEFADKVKSGQIKPQPAVSKATKANINESNKVNYKPQAEAPDNPASSAGVATPAAETPVATTPTAATPTAKTPAATTPASVGATGNADAPPANVIDSHAKNYEPPTPTEDVPTIDPPGATPASATSAPGSGSSHDSLPNYDSASPDVQEVSSSTDETDRDVTINQTYNVEQKDPPIPDAHVVAQAEVQSSYQSGQGERSVTLGSCRA